MMNGTGEEFLAGAALTEQQSRGSCRRHALDLLADFANGGVLADDAWKSVARGVLLSQQQVVPQQFLLARRTIHRQLQMVEVYRLLKKIERAFFHGGDRFFHASVGGQ